MTARDDAAAHLAKAQEFLEAAKASLDLDLYNAAASNAVTAGINAKDAICLIITGVSKKSDDHPRAVEELRASGPHGADLAPTLKGSWGSNPGRSTTQPLSPQGMPRKASIGLSAC